MSRRIKAFVLASAFLVVPTALAGSGSSTVPGAWHKLPLAPFAIPQSQASVWTGRELIVIGRRPLTNPAVRVAESYDPASNRWTRLAPPSDAGTVDLTGVKAVWTGKEMLAFGWNAVAYNPTTDTWRELRKTLPGGIVVWTGREAIGWGGGCCGDAWSNGTAYNPATDTYRNVPRAPLAASQGPLGAWTGRELDLFVSGFDPNDKAYPARLARAAAYNPTTNTWRRIAPLPGSDVRYSFRGTAVWDGREILVTGAGPKGQSAFSYNPRTNRWRKLAPLPAPRPGGTAVWTGKQLFVWGGSNLRGTAQLADGVAYDPKTDRWSTISRAPLRARYGPAVEWTGQELIVWGGGIPRKVGAPTFVRDGAAFTPTGQ
jgi:N-acetylneuraminic acid mutarotase